MMKTIKITKAVRDTETGELHTEGAVVERSDERAEAFVKSGYAQYVKVQTTPPSTTDTDAKASDDDDKPKKVKKTQPSPKVKKKSK